MTDFACVRVCPHGSQSDVHVVLLTGGTGFTSRDATPEAIKPLLEVVIDGFGELFRQLSYQEIGNIYDPVAGIGRNLQQYASVLCARVHGCVQNGLGGHYQSTTR